MRHELFDTVRWKLLSLGLAKHVDLWNHNVEFIEQEEAWDRPAVFLEFGPIVWTVVKDGEYRGRGTLRLHIVTDWAAEGSADEISGRYRGCAVWDLCGAIDRALRGIRGDTFHELRLVESHTNHNHEDLVETIEVYEVRGIRRSEVLPSGAPLDLVAEPSDVSVVDDYNE